MGRYIWGIGGPIWLEESGGSVSDLYKAGADILLNAGENAKSAAETFFNNMSPEERASFEDSLTRATNAGTMSPPTYDEMINTNGSSEGVSSTPTTVPESSPEATEPDSYEKWLSDAKTTAETNKQSILAGIENKRLDTHTDAEITRERSVVDARTSYQQALAGYGANAEALGTMGLTNSGYSDYLNANAYAQQRSDIQAAKATEAAVKKEADRLASDQKLSTETTYNEYLLGLDEKAATHAAAKEEKAEAEEAAKETAYYSLFDSAKSGNYTAEEIKDIAIRKGLNETDANYLASIAGTAIEQKQAANNATLSGAEPNDVLTAVNSGAISKEQGQQRIYEYWSEMISAGEEDVTAVETAYSTEQITPEQYNNLKNQWNANINTDTTTFYKNDGSKISKNEAAVVLSEYYSHPWISNETKEALQSAYDKVYGATQINTNVHTGPYNGDTLDADDLSKSGYYFMVTDGMLGMEGTKAYSVVSDGECKDNTVIDAGKNIEDGRVFGYENEVYIKFDGKVFKIKEGVDTDVAALKEIIVGIENNSAYQKIQDFITKNKLREGDRARWGQVFKGAGLLDVYNSLTSEEKKALVGVK